MTHLVLTKRADEDLESLKSDHAQQGRYKKTLKTLGLLQTNRKHPGLNIHKLQSLSQPLDDGSSAELWEAYIENNTPNAWRVFFHYGIKDTITVVAIQPHL